MRQASQKTHAHNERPTWLDLAHQKLDAAVFAAYGWDPAMSDDELLAKLLALNLKKHPAGNSSRPGVPTRRIHSRCGTAS